MSARNLLTFVIFISAAVSAFAGTESGKETAPPVVQDPLSKGTTELELLSGYQYSPIFTDGSTRPRLDYSGIDIRYGIVLSPTFFEHSFMRGNIEFLPDAYIYGITKGPGNYIVGGSLLFRYNFIQPGSHIIPYIQLGGGGLHSDTVNVPSQRVIGADFEFLLQADAGVRFLLNDRWSLLIEASFQHISNADTAARNVGVNALGGRVGLGWIY